MQQFLGYRGTILLAAVFGSACASSVVAAAPQLIRTGNTGKGGRVTFTNVSRPNAKKTVLIASNPVIRGDNLYAPDLVRVDDH